MATTPSMPRHYDALTPAQTPSREKMRLKGLWHGGEWWCNCDPRRRAVERQVQRATPNKGKSFWACSIPSHNPNGCGFFLWFQDAKLRETGLQPIVSDEMTVTGTQTPSRSKTSTSTSTPTPTMTQSRLTAYGIQVTGSRRRSDPERPRSSATEDPSSSGRGTEAVPTQTQKNEPSSSDPEKATTAVAKTNYTPLTPALTASSKRKRDAFADDYFSDVGSDEERQLADITDQSVEKITRHKSFNTPQASRAVEDVINTPSQPVARTLFPRNEASNKRQKTVSFEEPVPLPSPAKAPSPNASAHVVASTPPSSSPETSDDDITDQVMNLLHGQRIEESVLRSVHQLLVTSSRKTKGLIMSRDSARAALNEKNAIIVRLQEDIVAHENQERYRNSQITNIKANLMKMYEDN
ncbi:hypothetical protein PT974_08650 [Cladobotryum mycophilum]|uniref:GRF-type domain-containing protein n=1 Tax=Cladobotryum mycophilum TaxID=491253 RepID=A0ABR0SDX7_9HYPO